MPPGSRLNSSEVVLQARLGGIYRLHFSLACVTSQTLLPLPAATVRSVALSVKDGHTLTLPTSLTIQRPRLLEGYVTWNPSQHQSRLLSVESATLGQSAGRVELGFVVDCINAEGTNLSLD